MGADGLPQRWCCVPGGKGGGGSEAGKDSTRTRPETRHHWEGGWGYPLPLPRFVIYKEKG